jgi:hypothetical protein
MHFQAKGTLEKHPAPQCQTPSKTSLGIDDIFRQLCSTDFLLKALSSS